MLPFGEAIWRLTRQKRPAISTRTVFEDSLYIGAAMSLVIGGFYYWLYRVHGGVPYNFFSPPILNWLDPNVALERIAWTMLHCGLHVSPFAFIALRHRKLTGLSLTRKEITGIAIVALSLVAARICYGPTCAPTDSREFFDLGFGFDPWLRGRVTQLAGPSIPLYFTSLSLFDLATFSLAILGNLGIYLLLSDLYFAYRVSMRETDSTERRDDVPSQVRWGLDVFVLLLVVMANVGLFLVMANVYDRYMLPVELTSGILFARTYSRIRVPWQSWLLVCLLGIAGACFSQDYFCRHRAVWNAIADLHARGIPVAKINGGWEYTGVYRYNPQYRANGKLTGPYMRNLDPDLVAIHLAKFHPMILETPERIYNLTLTPLPGNDVVAEYPFRSWIHSGSIYVLKRRESK